MDVSIYDWLSVLQNWGTIATIPLMLIGIGLMLFGWRLWKLCVVLCFAVVGLVLGIQIGENLNQVILAPCLGVILFGVLAFRFAPVAIAVLGGLIGAGVLYVLGNRFKFDDSVLWITTSLGFFGSSALAVINSRHLAVLITSFLGALAFTSGLTSFVMAMPILYGTVRAMASYSMIVVPFLLIVPTVMSCFYQVSEIHRIREDL